MTLFDCHNDLLTQICDYDSYLNRARKQGLNSVILAIFLSEKRLNIKDIYCLVNKTYNIKDLYFAIEDISIINYNKLDKLKKIKPLYCSLTWNNSNKLAGGANSNGDISNLGYKYIDRIEEFSIIDTAHLNKKSFYSLAKYSKKPLLNSHTNLVDIYNHKRNLTNKQVKTIIKSNGLICLTGVKEFLGKNSTLDTYIESIYYFYKKFGANNVGLSTDFIGSSRFPLVYNNYSDFIIIYNRLKEKGIAEKDLEKIFYLNVMKFFNITKDNNR